MKVEKKGIVVVAESDHCSTERERELDWKTPRSNAGGLN